ncbi:MAG: sugar ABC transporter permease [Gaiellaceae bacterium]
MATPAPQNLAPDAPEQQVSPTHPLQMSKVLVAYGWTRLRQGELGVMPALAGLALIWAYFEIKQETFLSARNLSNLVLQISVTGTLAVGIVLVLLLSEIDLSVGSVSILCSAILGNLVVNQGWAWYWGIAVMLLAGAAVGAFQGAWIALLGVPSFVVTLAGLLGWQGVQQWVLGTTGTINVYDPHIGAIATTTLPAIWGWILAIVAGAVYALTRAQEQVRRRRAQLPAQPLVVVVAQAVFIAGLALLAVAILNGSLNSVWVFGKSFYTNPGVPTAAVILLGLVVFFAWVMKRTRFGRYVYAIGGNPEAARRAGINVAAIRIIAFTLCASLAAVGGLIQTSRLASASQAIDPGQVTLEAIAAAVIGGTSLFGGRGSVWSALLGAVVIGSVGNGLDLDGQQPYVKLIVEGAILLLFVTIDAIARRGRAGAGRS